MSLQNGPALGKYHRPLCGPFLPSPDAWCNWSLRCSCFCYRGVKNTRSSRQQQAECSAMLFHLISTRNASCLRASPPGQEEVLQGGTAGGPHGPALLVLRRSRQTAPSRSPRARNASWRAKLGGYDRQAQSRSVSKQ